MNNTKKHFLGIITLTAVMAFWIFSCKQEPDSESEPPPPPRIPTVLQNTTWYHTDNHKIEFASNSVKVFQTESSSGAAFSLKEISIVDDIDMTTMYFSTSKTTDFIVYRDGTITSVKLGNVDKANGWSKNKPDTTVTMPLELRFTTWTHTAGHSVEIGFDNAKFTAKVSESSTSSVTYKLTSVDRANNEIRAKFGLGNDMEVVYRNNTVYNVWFGYYFNETGQWTKTN